MNDAQYDIKFQAGVYNVSRNSIIIGTFATKGQAIKFLNDRKFTDQWQSANNLPQGKH